MRSRIGPAGRSAPLTATATVEASATVTVTATPSPTPNPTTNPAAAGIESPSHSSSPRAVVPTYLMDLVPVAGGWNHQSAVEIDRDRYEKSMSIDGCSNPDFRR